MGNARSRTSGSLFNPQSAAETSTPTLAQLSEATAAALSQLLPCAAPYPVTTTLCAPSKVRPGIAGAAVDAAADEACEVAALNALPGAGDAGYTAVLPVGDRVEQAAREVTGDHYWKWSGALKSTVRLAHYEAVKVAATVRARDIELSPDLQLSPDLSHHATSNNIGTQHRHVVPV